MYQRKAITFSIIIVTFLLASVLLVAAEDVSKFTPSSLDKNNSSSSNETITDFEPPSPRRPPPVPRRPPCRFCLKKVGKFWVPSCCFTAAGVADEKKETKT